MHLLNNVSNRLLDDYENAIYRPQWGAPSVSPSIARTCLQIYNETHGLFWRSNVFYFQGLEDSGSRIGVARTLKTMGQIASRLIQRVTIRMPLLSSNEYSGLRKVLRTLSSRARLGCFKRLELVWSEDGIDDLILGFMGMGDNMRRYDTLLQDLRAGCQGEKFERVVRLAKCTNVSSDAYKAAHRDLFEEIVKGLALAAGGSLVCEDKVVWENYIMVGHISDVLTERPPAVEAA